MSEKYILTGELRNALVIMLEAYEEMVMVAKLGALPVVQAPVVPSGLREAISGWHGPEGSKIMIPEFALDHLVSTITHFLTHQQHSGVPSFCVGCVHCFKDECSDWQGTLPTDRCKDKLTLTHREESDGVEAKGKVFYCPHCGVDAFCTNPDCESNVFEKRNGLSQAEIDALLSLAQATPLPSNSSCDKPEAPVTSSRDSVREAVEAELRAIDLAIHYETVAPPWSMLEDISKSIDRIRQAIAVLSAEVE